MSDKSEAKKSASRKVMDVAHPGKTAAEPTSKPVIVTNRPILQDPMMSEGTKVAVTDGSSEQASPTTNAKSKIQPLNAPAEPAKEEAKAEGPAEAEKLETEAPTVTGKPEVTGEKIISPLQETAETEPAVEAETTEPAAESKPAEEPADSASEAEQEQSDSAERKADAAEEIADDDAEAKAAAEHDAAIQKLVDSKEHFLPINSVEQRRTKRVIVLGVLLSLVLAAAWVDIALDAGLIHVDNVKPVTRFFSN